MPSEFQPDKVQSVTDSMAEVTLDSLRKLEPVTVKRVSGLGLDHTVVYTFSTRQEIVEYVKFERFLRIDDPALYTSGGGTPEEMTVCVSGLPTPARGRSVTASQYREAPMVSD